MKKFLLYFTLSLSALMTISCKNARNNTTAIEDNTLDSPEDETVFLTFYDDEEPSISNSDNKQKLYAEDIIGKTQERLDKFMAYGRAIERTASRMYSNSKSSQDGQESYEDYGLWRLSQCMNYFNSIQERFDKAYEYYYMEDYENAIHCCNLTLESIRKGHETYSSEVSEYNLDVFME